MTDPVEVETAANRVVVAVEIDAPREAVWAWLTHRERIARWWGHDVSLDARPGGRLVERWTDPAGRDVVTSGRVVRVSPGRELELTWADDDWPAETRVRFELEHSEQTTRLVLMHSGWEALARSDRARLMEAHRAGWSAHLAALARAAADSD